MTLPAVPDAASLLPVRIAEECRQVVVWAAATDDVAAVKEMADKWSTLADYARKRSREGVAEITGAVRRLEVRVGELLGPAHHGGRREPAARRQVPRAVLDVHRNEKVQLRTMAANPEMVDQVIAESTDTDPPSRRKVIAAIKGTNGSELEQVCVMLDRATVGLIDRWAAAKAVSRAEIVTRTMARAGEPTGSRSTAPAPAAVQLASTQLRRRHAEGCTCLVCKPGKS